MMSESLRCEIPASKIRILLVTDSLALGGIERFVRNLSISLLESGSFEPSICCVTKRSGPFLGDVLARDIPVYECRLESPHFLSFSWRFCRLLKQAKPDIMHSQVNWSMPWQVLGAKLARVPSLFFTERNTYRRNRIQRLRAIVYDRFTSPFIDVRSAISQGVQDHLARQIRRGADGIAVTYNGVDLESFAYRPGLRDPVRRSLALPVKSPVVGVVASLSRQKGHIFLIESAPVIISRFPECRFLIVGDGPLRPNLIQQARECAVSESFVFVGNRTDVADLYGAMDVLVLPSLWEGFGQVLIEAQASGVPIVATSVGGIPEILDGGQAGLLVPPGDVSALTDAILRVLGDEDLSGELRSRGLEQVKKFSLENCVSRYRQIYEELVDRKGRYRRTLRS